MSSIKHLEMAAALSAFQHIEIKKSAIEPKTSFQNKRARTPADILGLRFPLVVFSTLL